MKNNMKNKKRIGFLFLIKHIRNFIDTGILNNLSKVLIFTFF